MPQPITHFTVVKKAMEDSANQLWAEYGNFSGFGSFGPDLFYVKDVLLRKLDPSLNYDQLSDTLHSDKSFRLFCTMLNVVKQNWASNFQAAQKQLAYAIGYYAHVVTDCIFHPYVYRKSNDHWKLHEPKQYYSDHKKIEALIDSHILNNLGVDPDLSYFTVTCDHPADDDMLDPDIADLLAIALSSVYPEVVHEEFSKYNLLQKKHPIHAAYNDFKNIAQVTYGAQNVLFELREHLSRSQFVKKLSDKEIEQANGLHGSWYPIGQSSLLTYSVDELFDFAVKGVKQVIASALLFIQSDAMDAEQYLSGIGVIFLDQNWNLDTGLPDCLNSVPENSVTDASRYDFEVQTLVKNYEALKLG